MADQQYEYLLLRLAEARATHITERINQHADEGYEPVIMCGDATLSVLLRRPKPADKPASE
jgi:hypothetical protein